MRYIFSFFLILIFNFIFSQNNVRLFSGTGKLFTVNAFDTLQNKIPQANVLIQYIYEDSLPVKIEFEDKTKLETTLFLFEKGKPTKNKEFNYRIDNEKNKFKLSYSGFYEITKLPDPLVPKKPEVDTSSKYKNIFLGHFCELKDEKPIYFNNLPKTGSCIKGMPAEYLNYINLLTLKAQVPDDKFIIMENVCRNNCLTVEQLSFILKYIDFEIEKLKLIKIAYFNVVDKNNNKALEKSFRFESSISELNSFFKTASDPKALANANCTTASGQNEIDGLVDKLKVYTNDSQRYEAFKKLYSEFCYTKDQIVLILNTYIHDREKFDSAKMLYYKCAEKDKFLSISEVFSYNETISELKDFVAKQKD